LAWTLVACAPALAAPVVVVDADLRRGAERVTGVFTVTVEVRAADGTVLVAESSAGVVIVDGLFSGPVDLAPALSRLEAGETITLDLDLGEVRATTPIGPALLARVAARADVAATTPAAARLGDIAAADLIDVTDAPSVVIANANLVDVPAGVGDGVDDGNVLTLNRLVIDDRKLEVRLGALTSTAIVDGTLTALQLADGQLSSRHIGALDQFRVAANTLTAANFATGAFALADVATRNVVRWPSACVNGGTVSTTATCTRRTDGCSAGQRRNCTTAACETTASTTCTAPVIGRIVLP
jgi:hypothetical protein